MASLGEKELPAHQVELVREAMAGEPLGVGRRAGQPSRCPHGRSPGQGREAGIPMMLVNRPLAGTDSKQVATKGRTTRRQEDLAIPKARCHAAQDNSTSRAA